MIIINNKEVLCQVEGCEKSITSIRNDSAACAEHKGTKTKMPKKLSKHITPKASSGKIELEGEATIEVEGFDDE